MMTDNQIIEFATKAYQYLNGKVNTEVPATNLIFMQDSSDLSQPWVGVQKINHIFLNVYGLNYYYNDNSNTKIKSMIVIVLINELSHIEQCLVDGATGLFLAWPDYQDANTGNTAHWLSKNIEELENVLHVKRCHKNFIDFINDNISKHTNPASPSAKYHKTSAMNFVWHMILSPTYNTHITSITGFAPECTSMTDLYQHFKQIWDDPDSNIQYVSVLPDKDKTYNCLVKINNGCGKLSHLEYFFGYVYGNLLLDGDTSVHIEAAYEVGNLYTITAITKLSKSTENDERNNIIKNVY